MNYLLAFGVCLQRRVLLLSAFFCFFFFQVFVGEAQCPSPGGVSVNPSTNVTTLYWGDGCGGAVEYQLQVLRLYNTDANTASSELDITAKVDWSEALTIETNNTDPSFNLTLAEGTGYYVWRVRGITANYPGGIADDRNWGGWSSTGSLINGATVHITSGNGADLFYYDQFDKNINWIYHRQFVEGEADHGSQTRVGEKMTYASSLLMPIQEQARVQSSANTLASQTVPDYSGRPAFKTLPAPLNREGFGYENSFVQSANRGGYVYTAEDFDDQSNAKTPSPVFPNSKIEQYYSDQNSDLQIPSSGGLPFTRTLYYNDGLNRPREIASPGPAHNFGAHTVRKYYSKTTATELIRIFGDEAPDASSVLKTYTADPNGVFDVTYTDEQGHTIATCLSAPLSDLLDPIPSNVFTAYDTINKRINVNPTRIMAKASYAFAIPTKLDYLLNIVPKIYDDKCLGICASCDYKINLTATDRDDPDPSHAYVMERYLLPSVDSLGNPCMAISQDFGETYKVNNTITLDPGTYDISLFIEVANENPVTHKKYIDEVVETMHRKLTTVLNGTGNVIGGNPHVDITTMKSYVDQSNITGLMSYLAPDLSKPFFNLVVGCDTFTLPTASCNGGVDCNNPKFSEYMISYLKNFNSMFSGVNDLTQVEDGPNNLFIASNAEFNTVIKNMILDGYDCSTLWDAWQKTVQGYAIAQKSVNFSTQKVDWWSDFMGRVGYKFPLEIKPANDLNTAGSQVRTKPYIYIPYDWGSKANIEKGFCDFYQSTHSIPPNSSACGTGPTAIWFTTMANFPVDPQSNNYHVFSLYKAIRANTVFNGLATSSATINPANAVAGGAQSYAGMQEICLRSCEGRLNDLVPEIAGAWNDKLYAVEGFSYPTWNPAPLGTITQDYVYGQAQAIIKQCTAGCYLSPVNGIVPQAQIDNYTKSLNYSIDVDVDPSLPTHLSYANPSCNTAGGYLPATYAGQDLGQDLIGWLNLRYRKIADSLTQLVIGGPFNWQAFNNTGTFANSTCLFSTQTVPVYSTDKKGWFSADIPVNSTVSSNAYIAVFQRSPVKGLTGIPHTRMELRCVLKTALSATDSVVLEETIPSSGVSIVSTGFVHSNGKLHYAIYGPRIAGDTVVMTYFVANNGGVGSYSFTGTATRYTGASNMGSCTANANLTMDNCAPLYYNRIDANGVETHTLVCNQICNGGVDAVYGICMKWVAPTSLDPGTATQVHPVTCAEVVCQSFGTSFYTQVAQAHVRHESALRDLYGKRCANRDAIDYLFINYFDLNQYAYTLYYYDRAGNISKTVSPGGVNENSTDRLTHPGHNFITEYDYNTLGQVLRKKSPDGGEIKYYYDSNGRLRFSQDAKQWRADVFSYTKYDEQNRVIETGQMKPNYDPTQLIDDPTFPTPGNNPYPSVEFVTATTYDEPFSMGGWAGYPVLSYAQKFLHNRVSYVITDKDGDFSGTNDEVITVYSYDAQGNVSDYYSWAGGGLLNEFRHVGYEYDLVSGKPTQVNYNVSNNASLSEQEQFSQRYSYDGDKRLVKVESGTNVPGANWYPEAQYSYYLHGPLRRHVVGGNAQGIDYTYTLEGWLKAINHSSDDVSDDPGHDDGYYTTTQKDAFGMVLDYYSGDFNRSGSPFNNTSGSSKILHVGDLYNGNIKSWAQRITPVGGLSYEQTVGYTYNYDQLNRLKLSSFNYYDGSSWQQNNAFSEGFDHDLNGNLTSLWRNRDGNMVDNLSYTYAIDQNTMQPLNQLESVYNSSGSSGYNEVENTSYIYNESGNMTWDSKGNSYFWTPSGKLDNIFNLFTYSWTQYYYDGTGNRVRARTPNGEEYYVRTADGNVLAHLTNGQIDERYIYGSERLGVIQGPNWGPQGVALGTKAYELHDHLGNTRAVVSDQSATILNYFNYYAFGSLQSGRYYNGLDYRFGFNGQEKTDYIAGTGNHNTAKFWEYDTRIGRRWNLDPKPQISIGDYAVMGNNPIWHTDVLGDTSTINGTAKQKMDFLSQINSVSSTPFKINAKNQLVPGGPINLKTSGTKSGLLATDLVNAYSSAKPTYFNLVENDPSVLGDSYRTGKYDVSDFNKYSANPEFLAAMIDHVFVERMAAPKYLPTNNDMTQFSTYHNAALESETNVLRDLTGDKDLTKRTNSLLELYEINNCNVLHIQKYNFDYGKRNYLMQFAPVVNVVQTK